MKCRGGVVKGLLRAAGEEVLPHEILYRKKVHIPRHMTLIMNIF